MSKMTVDSKDSGRYAKLLASVLTPDCLSAQPKTQHLSSSRDALLTVEGTTTSAGDAGFKRAPDDCLDDPGALVRQPLPNLILMPPAPGAPQLKYRGLDADGARAEGTMKAPGAPKPRRRLIDPLAAADCLAETCLDDEQ